MQFRVECDNCGSSFFMCCFGDGDGYTYASPPRTEPRTGNPVVDWFYNDGKTPWLTSLCENCILSDKGSK